MLFKWLGRVRGSKRVTDLIARRKYGQAIELWRAELQGKSPGAVERLQFVDLLVTAGRSQEAIPILVGLADEQAAGGLLEHALETLDRVEAIDPGRADVHSRRVTLLARQGARPAEAGEPLMSPAGGLPLETPEPGLEREVPPDTVEIEAAPEQLVADTFALGAAGAEDAEAAISPLGAVDPLLPFVVSVISSSPLAGALFSGLSLEQLRAVRLGLCRKDVPAGARILNEGDEGDGLYLLASGRVAVLVRNPEGRELQVAELLEGDFFGEVSALSGKPRSASVVATAPSALLEVQKPTLDALARTRDAVRQMLEEAFVERLSSPEAAAVRRVTLGANASRERTDEILMAYFGDKRWGPRMRLRLADLLLRAGNVEEALPVLAALVDELARAGRSTKALAVLRKIDRIQRRDVEELCLAPLLRAQPEPPDAGRPRKRARRARRRKVGTVLAADGWLRELARDVQREAS